MGKSKANADSGSRRSLAIHLSPSISEFLQPKYENIVVAMKGFINNHSTSWQEKIFISAFQT
jgi:hypothetical protein